MIYLEGFSPLRGATKPPTMITVRLGNSANWQGEAPLTNLEIYIWNQENQQHIAVNEINQEDDPQGEILQLRKLMTFTPRVFFVLRA